MRKREREKNYEIGDRGKRDGGREKEIGRR